MKNKNLSWVGALFVFALLLWCTAATPGTIADPASYAPGCTAPCFPCHRAGAEHQGGVHLAVVGIASGALLYANGNLELALNTLFFNEDGGMITKLSDSSNVGILPFW